MSHESYTETTAVCRRQAEIQRRTAKHFEALDISAERILRELLLLAFANVADHAEAGFRYADKIKTLELLGKYQKLFTERNELLPSPEEYDFSEIKGEEVTTLRDLLMRAVKRQQQLVMSTEGCNDTRRMRDVFHRTCVRCAAADDS